VLEVTLPGDLYSGIETRLGQLPEEVARTTREHIQLARQAGLASVEGLAEAIEGTAVDLATQLAACDLLGRLGVSYRRSAESVANLLASTEKRELLWESARALALMRAGYVVEILLTHLESTNPERGAATAWTLGRLGNPSSVQPLRAVLRNTKAQRDLRAHAAEALGALASNDAVPDLIAALEDSSAEVRYWAAYALGQIGDPEALPALERLAQKDHRAIGTLGSVAEEASSAVELIRMGGSHPQT
jgi:hypothetical protein